MMKGCWQMVFQQQREAKQLLDGVVSAMMEVRKMMGWKKMKNAEQWCFSIWKTDERLLVIGVSATGENERLLVFQQRGKMKGCWCFSNGNSEKMAEVGRNEKC
jgi:hypothetical protein